MSIRLWLLALIFVPAMMAAGGNEVPIYEREPPTDPEELKKYYKEMEAALKAMDQTVADEKKKSLEAALAPQKSNPQEPDLEIPERDEDQIEIASRRVLTAGTINADVADLVKKLRAGLDDESVEEAGEFLKLYGGKPAALANAAAIAWVQEAPGTALLLAAEAAQRSPGNANALNTLGALLADAGYAERGIPILAYLATKFPDDATLQNNLGQAWLALGATEQAQVRFLACLGRAPAHGPANASMGVIKYRAGDQAAATKHFQAAAKSNSSPLARRALDRLDEPYTIPRSFYRLAPVQEFFNPHHFVPPEGQQNFAQAEAVSAQIAQFTDLVQEYINKAGAAMGASGEKTAQDFSGGAPSQAVIMAYAPAAAMSNLDLKHLASAYEGQLKRGLEFQRDLEAFATKAEQHWENAESVVSVMRDEFVKRWKTAAENKEIGEGGSMNQAFIADSEAHCAKCRAVMEQALPAIAVDYAELVLTVSTRERVAVNEELTYLPLLFGGELYKQQFYAIVITHLQRMAMLAQANRIRTYECMPPSLSGPDSPPVGDFPGFGKCPIKLSVDVKVAKFKADCTSIGFEVKAGVQISAKKNFASGETTLTGGVGADMDLKGIGKVEGSGQFVVVWDRGDNLSFVGVQSSASASISGIPGLEGEVDVDDNTTVGGSLPTTGTPDIVNVSSETTLGVTLGPRGLEPTLHGNAGAEVLGRDLVRAEL